MSMLESLYEERTLMPYPVCHECAEEIHLDVFTYWDYSGSITCAKCKSRMNVVFSGGALLKSEPVIKREFVDGLHKDIPEQPLGDYLEALTCLVYRAFKASAVMARRSIQGALLIKSVPEDSPSKMIEWATNHGTLSQKEKNLAATVTFFGNKSAHPQDVEINQVGELEASQGLIVTKALLLKLYPPVVIKPASSI